MAAPYGLAKTQLAFGQFIVKQGGDLLRAELLLQEAEASARQHGYRIVAERAVEELERLGVRRP